MEKEAEAQDQVENSLDALQGGGSLHQVMLAQLQQNQILLERLTTPKHTDPVLGALAGGSDGSSSSSSGVKGMIAREAFVKAIQEVSKVAASCQQRALTELGYDETKLDASLMRRYVERRVPLAENRQLTYMAFMLSEAWAAGHESSNVELQGWVCKMMIVIEQICIDGGRLNLAWLLSGQQDPPFHLLVQNRRRPGLQPFSRLASPSWISANLAYVRDLDVLGRARKQNAHHGKGRQDQTGCRGATQRCGSWTKAPTPTREAKTRTRRSGARCKRDRPVTARQHHDDDSMACSSEDFCDLASEHSYRDFQHKPEQHTSSQLPFDLPDLTNPKEFFKPLKLVQGLINQFWNCPSALTAFARKSLSSGTCNPQGKCSPSLWPVPPVRWRWTAASRLGPRRRRRRHFYRIRHELLQVVLISLNWETLGFPTSPPKEAVLGAPISAQQHAIIERIEGMLNHFLHMSPFGADDLGRSNEKFQAVINLIQSFPKCKLDVEVLEQGFLQLHEDLDSYRNRVESKPSSSTVDDPSHLHCSDVGTVAKTSLASAKPVIADRVKWSYPPSFDAQEFLNPVVREAYNDPEVLRKPVSEWPPSRPARMHIERHEFLKLVDKWDQLGACMLVDVAEFSMEEAVGIFCVAKDSQFDRLIINPKTINGRMDTITESTKELAPGSMLGLLNLADDEVFRFQADDLSDFYYTFKVPVKRALRNTFRLVLDWKEVRHLKCFAPKLKNRQVAVALKTLAMGDSLAVEIAQQAHCNVLKQLCGAMIHKETLKYRSPVPRSDFIEHRRSCWNSEGQEGRVSNGTMAS